MGRVFLVGAGPGDPELLTVKAMRLLGQAEVVLHDALVSPEILALVRPEAKVINVGKRCGRPLLSQAEINCLLVRTAQATPDRAVIVRLKGGDPTIFGRAGEEIRALAEAGVAYEIVPGITAALAGAAAAGISLTDRHIASSVVFTTAHRAAEAAGNNSSKDWRRLVNSGSTLVLYMPGNNYRALGEQLRSAGLSDDTPCTVVSSAGSIEQQVLWSTLGAVSRRQALPAPAVLILGRCARALADVQVPEGDVDYDIGFDFEKSDYPN